MKKDLALRLVEDSPQPTSIDLQTVADTLRIDGLSEHAATYRERATIARELERRIEATGKHFRDIAGRMANVAQYRPDDPSAPRPDRSEDRGKYLAAALIEMGWAPPSDLAFRLDFNE